MHQTFTPSNYQKTIFRFVEAGHGDGIVRAVAGSGKTTTLIEAAKLIRSNQALFVAFNKSITETLKTRLKNTNMVAKTIHSVGFGCLTRAIEDVKVDDGKYKILAKEWIDENIPSAFYVNKLEFMYNLSQLANLVRLTLTDPTDQLAVSNIADRYGIDASSELIKGVNEIIDRGDGLATQQKVIDFTDMLWLPFRWNLQPKQVEWIFVDEAQDLSAAATDLVFKCRMPGGRMLFVGDPKQAIYGFAGADTQSFERIKKHIRANDFPLSICYRCPKSHIELAQEIVPYLEPSPTAPKGIIHRSSSQSLPKLVRADDLILSRTTAPLVSWCIKLIEQNISARVNGRDIGKDLSSLAYRIAQQPEFEFEDFIEFVDLYEDAKIRRLSKRINSEAQMQSLRDRCEAL